MVSTCQYLPADYHQLPGAADPLDHSAAKRRHLASQFSNITERIAVRRY
jgi:hypothetical protein